MLSIVLVLGVHITIRMRNTYNTAQVYKNDNEYARQGVRNWG